MNVVSTLTTSVSIKSHPTDKKKVILTVGSTDYELTGAELIVAVNNAMMA